MPGVPAMVRIPGSAHSKDPKRWSLPGWRHRRHRQQNRHHQQRHQNRLHQHHRLHKHHRLHQRHRHQYWLRQGPKIKIVRFWGISRIYAHAITCKISPPQTFWGILRNPPQQIFKSLVLNHWSLKTFIISLVSLKFQDAICGAIQIIARFFTGNGPEILFLATISAITMFDKAFLRDGAIS